MSDDQRPTIVTSEDVHEVHIVQCLRDGEPPREVAIHGFVPGSLEAFGEIWTLVGGVEVNHGGLTPHYAPAGDWA